MNELHPETLTWTALLAKWMDFARASVALPDDAEGQRWRDAVPAVINLQAVTFALGDVERLESSDRPHARDKAELLIRENVRRLNEIWRGDTMPASLLETSFDAREALEMSIYIGAVELHWEGHGELIMPAVPIDDPTGTLAVMQPGTIVMPSEPVAWWVERDSAPLVDALRGCVEHRPPLPRQVYRQLDEDGAIVGDVIAPINADLPAGMPLLVPLYQQGRTIGRFTLDPDTWLAQQRAAMRGETIPVEFRE
jgi:hypothetical protein